MFSEGNLFCSVFMVIGIALGAASQWLPDQYLRKNKNIKHLEMQGTSQCFVHINLLYQSTVHCYTLDGVYPSWVKGGVT